MKYIRLCIVLCCLSACVHPLVAAGELPANPDTPPKTPDVSKPGATAADTPPAASSDGTDALSFFKNTGVNYSSRAVVIAADILAAQADLGDHHRLGILLTGALPANNPSSADYVTSELLQRNGAVGNLYFSFHSLKRGDEGAWLSQTSHPRRADKSYFQYHLPKEENKDGTKVPKDMAKLTHDDLDKLNNQLLPYFINGWGGRMYRPSSAPGTANQYYGVATGYIGVGVDGIATDTLNQGANPGSLQVETYISGNYTSARTLNTIYGVKNAGSYFTTASFSLKLNVSSYTISIGYSTSLTHWMRGFARDVATISVSYKDVTAKPKAGGT